MSKFIWGLIFVVCAINFAFLDGTLYNLDTMTERYTRALDSGADAAARYRAYKAENIIVNQASGFGTGYEHSSNVQIDRDESLKWFYILFFRNLGIGDSETQEKLKLYMPMKALVSYDRLMMADLDDNWVYDEEYIIRYRGQDYKFTLSDQVYNMVTNTWTTADQIGLTEEQRKMLVTDHIKFEMTKFLNNRKNKESGKLYKLNFSLDESNDKKLSGINGINFIVFSEGMPMPSLNPFYTKRLYTFGIGGSEIIRGN